MAPGRIDRAVGTWLAPILALVAAGCSAPTEPSGLVIRNVTVISAERAAPLERADVRILDGRIAELSERPLRGEEEVFGFTTLVDLIGTAERTARWNALDLRPAAYFCGGAAIVERTVQFVPVPYFSYDQADRNEPVQHTPASAVARLADDGAICVKTFSQEGGRGSRPHVSGAGRRSV